MKRILSVVLPRLVLALLLLWSKEVQAGTTINVTSQADVVADDGLCTLREAIIAANTDTTSGANPGECPAGSGADVITLAAGTYTLAIPGRLEQAAATGDLDIRQDLTITGDGQETTIINAGRVDRAFDVVFSGLDVNMSGLTIRGGDVGTGTSAPYSGGGIAIASGSALTLTQVTVTDNWASYGNLLQESGSGGGIYNNGGVVSLTNCTISQNKAGFAGGLYNGGTFTLQNSTVSDNMSTFYGGGIESASDPLYSPQGLTLTASTVSGNVSGTNGGGLYLSLGNATISNSTISGNRVSTGGWLGGGVWVYYQATLNVTNSTIYDNFAGTGGGIYNYHQQGALDLPGGILGVLQLGNITLQGTIVANNGGGNCARSSQTDPINSLGYNLDSGISCEFNVANNDLNNTDPRLGPLQDNGGDTWTHALLNGSPAVDPAGYASCLAVDQRGINRPQGSACDIGAFEAVPGTDADLALVKTVSDSTVQPGAVLTYTLSLGNNGPNALTNAAVSDTLPAGTVFVAAAGSGWICNHVAGVVDCTLPAALASGGTAPDIMVTVNAPAAAGVITNTATAVPPSPFFDPDQSNNTASAQTTVVDPVQEQADLTISQQASAIEVSPGVVLTYTLSVVNNGPDAATAVTVTDKIPANVTFLSLSGGDWQCTHPGDVICTRSTLAAGAAPDIIITVQAPNSAGLVTNTAVVSTATLDPITGNNTAAAETAVRFHNFLPAILSH